MVGGYKGRNQPNSSSGTTSYRKRSLRDEKPQSMVEQEGRCFEQRSRTFVRKQKGVHRFLGTESGLAKLERSSRASMMGSIDAEASRGHISGPHLVATSARQEVYNLAQGQFFTDRMT